mmetsp:Transcript_56461/g.83917  ORF Transcript_56461/g.83917 Transcript_56461/m.83917 type:complete len:97 (+) Transcript_56461:60-350(+)
MKISCSRSIYFITATIISGFITATSIEASAAVKTATQTKPSPSTSAVLFSSERKKGGRISDTSDDDYLIRPPDEKSSSFSFDTFTSFFYLSVSIPK